MKHIIIIAFHESWPWNEIELSYGIDVLSTHSFLFMRSGENEIVNIHELGVNYQDRMYPVPHSSQPRTPNIKNAAIPFVTQIIRLVKAIAFNKAHPSLHFWIGLLHGVECFQ